MIVINFVNNKTLGNLCPVRCSLIPPQQVYLDDERATRSFFDVQIKHWHAATIFNSVDVRQTSGVVSALITIEVLLHCGAKLCAHHTDTEKNYFLNVTHFPKGLV